MLYTLAGLTELEVLRVADWMVDLPLPGAPAYPLRRSAEAVRVSYNRLPPWWLRRRVGEFMSALQLPQLSLGDANATYTLATGGMTGPGSGMVMRVHRIVDWAQHLLGDVNCAIGWPVGRRQGLIRWALPERTVDGTQWVVLKAFNGLAVVLSRAIDKTVTFLELGGELALNVGRHRPHEEDTVFLQLPMGAYRAHELWILEHRPNLVIGGRRDFVNATHAALAHRRRPARLEDWSPVDRPEEGPEPVLIMTTARVFARAPVSLRPYVVPAAWVLEGTAPSLQPLTRQGNVVP